VLKSIYQNGLNCDWILGAFFLFVNGEVTAPTVVDNFALICEVTEAVLDGEAGNFKVICHCLLGWGDAVFFDIFFEVGEAFIEELLVYLWSGFFGHGEFLFVLICVEIKYNCDCCAY